MAHAPDRDRRRDRCHVDGSLRPSLCRLAQKTVTVVVPYAAGGNTDIMARLATEWLSNRLGQRLVVENRVGAGATLGAAYVAKADPDGYTVLFGAARISWSRRWCRR